MQHVLEVVIRCPNEAAASWILEQIQATLAEQPDANLDAAGLFTAKVYDAEPVRRAPPEAGPA